MEVLRKAKDAVSEKAHEFYQMWPKVKDFVSEMSHSFYERAPSVCIILLSFIIAHFLIVVWDKVKDPLSEMFHSFYQRFPKVTDAVNERAPSACIILLSCVAAHFLHADCVRATVLKTMLMPTLLLVEGMDPTVAGPIAKISIMLIPLVGVFIQIIAVVGGGTWGENGLWLDFTMVVAYRTAATFILPLYFYLVEMQNNSAARTRARPSYSIRVILPWKLGAVRMDGRAVRVLTAKGVLRGLAAFGIFYSLIGATTTAAVMAARLQLLQRWTVRVVMRIASATSLIFCAPLFLLPSLESHNSFCANIALFVVVIPATIATVLSLDSWDVCSMGELMIWTDYTTGILWNVILVWAFTFR